MMCQVFSEPCLHWVSCGWGDRLSGLLGLPCRPLRLVLRDHAQIVGDHPQSDPPFHATVAMIPPAVQPMTPFEPTDPPFDPRPPIATLAEPALAFMCLPRLGLPARPRQHDVPYSTLLCQPLVSRGGQLAI